MHDYLISVLRKAYHGGYSGRDDDAIHASDLEDFCSREYALCRMLGEKYNPRRYHGLGQSVTYEIGTAVHRAVRSRLKKRGVLVGRWECPKCDVSVFGLPACPSCKSDRLIYHEPNIRYKISGDITMTGSVDSIVTSPGGHSFINEIKSIKTEKFKTMKKPEAEHVRRVVAYLWLMRHSRSSDFKKFAVSADVGTVLYVAKEYQDVPFKAFSVSLSDYSAQVKHLDGKMSELRTFAKMGKVPPRICSTQFASMAKKCAVRVQCFDRRRLRVAPKKQQKKR